MQYHSDDKNFLEWIKEKGLSITYNTILHYTCEFGSFPFYVYTKTVLTYGDILLTDVYSESGQEEIKAPILMSLCGYIIFKKFSQDTKLTFMLLNNEKREMIKRLRNNLIVYGDNEYFQGSVYKKRKYPCIYLHAYELDDKLKVV